MAIDDPRSMFDYMITHTQSIYDRPLQIENVYYPRFRLGKKDGFSFVMVDTSYKTNDIHDLFELKNLSRDFEYSNKYAYYIIYKPKMITVRDEIDALYASCQKDFGMSVDECLIVLKDTVDDLEKANPLIIRNSQQQCIFVKYYPRKSEYQLWLTFISTTDESCQFKPSSTTPCKAALQNAFVKLFQLFQNMNLKINLHLYDDAYVVFKDSKMGLLEERIKTKKPYRDLSIYSKFGAKFPKTQDLKRFKDTYKHYIKNPSPTLLPEVLKIANHLKTDMTIKSSKFADQSWCAT